MTRKEDLAVNGGPKAFSRIRGKSRPKIGAAEFISIAERFGFSQKAMARLKRAVSDQDLPPNGPHLGRYYGSASPSKGEQFENLARKLFSVKYAFAVSSGTGALHSAFAAAGVGPGAEVICPGLGFAATSMAVIMAGGVPVFCDVDESLQIDPSKIEACITPRTVAIAPTHHWGNVADMDPIMRVAEKRGLKVIEDCAQAPGATYRGRHVGTIGHTGCFSISAYKIIGGGEGGLVVTNDERLFDRIRQMAEGGGLWRPDRFAQPRYDGELFPGTNYRMSELEASVNVVQIRKLRQICDRYRRVSTRILRRMKTYSEIRPQTINDADGWIGYQIRFFPATHELSLNIARALQAEGIGAWTRGPAHSPDWHLCADMLPVVLKQSHAPGGSVFEDPRYTSRGGAVDYKGICPVARDLFAREVSVGIDQWWTAQDADDVANGINKVLSAFCSEDPNGKKWM